MKSYFNFVETKEIRKIKRQIEIKILFYLQKLLVKDLLQISDKHLQNDSNIIKEAIRSGKIYYANDGFYFKQNISILLSKELAKLGAIYKDKSFKIPFTQLPSDIQMTILNKSQKDTETIRMIENKVKEDIDFEATLANLDFEIETHQILYEFDKQLVKKVENVIGIEATFTDAMKEGFAKEYTESIKLAIKNWTDEQIIKMRQEVSKRVLSGTRASDLVNYIQEINNQSKTKAEFLANNETRLVLTKYQQQRYKDNEWYKYKWVHPNPSSPTARKVHVQWHNESKNGRIFDLRNPPINPDTGKAENAGEAYNCGCVMRIIVDE